ncbi:hypothetical protein LIG30_2200 [Burkholderia sp. lig30]|jgi:hypothetical protein|uniref:hypothetical protein n=1 Tax=Burkholderia sp. lig30 TaxID=1192124 RepID=UPI0004617FB5|nr:hypothetical protein [Burkholderia sp. lig30]KDB08742.1 hypothetical protein LIG30_2200 [Burkholderia sp. lig30]
MNDISTDRSRVRHYCTLFDRNYLIKGLAMYQSLERHAGDFRLHILCMDDHAYDLLARLALPRAELIRLTDFEDQALLAVKADRTVAEYCWTCAPCLPVYMLERHPEVDFITYLDADLLFYSSLEPLYAEIGSASSVIVEHRFSPRFASAIVNGRYNVQWVSFRRDAAGLETLYWWRDKCIEWCFYRLEDDRMGDQKYLDCWTTKFKGVHELQHVGAGTGPWNYANYRIRDEGGQVWVDDVPLVFYHFHSYRILPDGQSIPMPAAYMEGVVFPKPIFDRYDSAILDSLDTIRKVDPAFSCGIDAPGEALRAVHTTKSTHSPDHGAQVAGGRIRAKLSSLWRSLRNR